ncbi:hypothetical protein HDU99_005018, partial [Rhizoclosmatium hyalinum]
MTSYETLPDMANVSISKTRISSIAVADSFRIVPKAMNSDDGANNPVQIKPATQIVPEIIDAAKRNGFWTDTSTNPIVIHSADAYFIQDTGGIDSANTSSSQANGLQPQMEQVNQKFYSKKAEIPITNIESGSFGRVFADSHDAGNGSGPVTVQVQPFTNTVKKSSKGKGPVLTQADIHPHNVKLHASIPSSRPVQLYDKSVIDTCTNFNYLPDVSVLSISQQKTAESAIASDAKAFKPESLVAVAYCKQRQPKIGRYAYAPPESFIRGYKVASGYDVYSFGMTMYEVLGRLAPFSNSSMARNSQTVIQLLKE